MQTGLPLSLNVIFVMRNMRLVKNISMQPDDQGMSFLAFFAQIPLMQNYICVVFKTYEASIYILTLNVYCKTYTPKS